MFCLDARLSGSKAWYGTVAHGVAPIVLVRIEMGGGAWKKAMSCLVSVVTPTFQDKCSWNVCAVGLASFTGGEYCCCCVSAVLSISISVFPLHLIFGS